MSLVFILKIIMSSKSSKEVSGSAKDLPDLSGSEKVSNTVPETVQNSEISSGTPEVANIETAKVQSASETASPESVPETMVVQEESAVVDSAKVIPNGNKGSYPRMGSFSDRLIAFIVDLIIIYGLSFVIGLLVGIPFGIMSGLSGSKNSSFFESGAQLVGALFGIVLLCIYYGYFYNKKGQTPGKMLMKLKVVRAEDLQYVSWGRAIIRQTVGAFINNWLFYLGYLWYFMSQKRQTWGDSLVKTYVVKTDDKGEIYMDGPESYEKSAVKTFLPCGCCGLIYLVLIIAMVISITAGVMALSKSVDKGGSGYPNGNGYQYKYDSNKKPYILDDYHDGTDFNRYYYDDSGSETVPPLNYDYDTTDPDKVPGSGSNPGPGSGSSPKAPDFPNMTEEELNQYLQKQLNMQLQQ